MENDNRPSAELLESTHEFPGPFKIKAIGPSGGDFVARVLDAAHAEVGDPALVERVERTTPSGRHVSVTLDFRARDAEQVRALYARIREIEGLTLLL